ncbi:hypothetical protein AKJ16_DCAP12439 [Drosera capensis]
MRHFTTRKPCHPLKFNPARSQLSDLLSQCPLLTSPLLSSIEARSSQFQTVKAVSTQIPRIGARRDSGRVTEIGSCNWEGT